LNKPVTAHPVKVNETEAGFSDAVLLQGASRAGMFLKARYALRG